MSTPTIRAHKKYDNVYVMQPPGTQEMRQESQKVHNDETRICESCHIGGSHERRLRLCQGCKFSWYCSSECQKSHWKEHKAACKQRQKELSAGPQGVIRVQEAMRIWINEKNWALSFAGDEALMPSRDRPDHNLLGTHIVVVNLIEKPRGSGKLEVLQVRVGGHEEMLENFLSMGAPEQYYDFIERLAKIQKGTEEQTGEKIFGTMHTMIRCVVDGHLTLQCHPLFIKQSGVAERLQVDHQPDWAEKFKLFSGIERGFYRGPDGQVFGVTKKKGWRSMDLESETPR